MDPDNLVNLADNKFKNLTVRGKWMAPTEEEEKIITLKAKIKQLEKKTKAKGKRNGDPKKGAKVGNKPNASLAKE